MTKKYLPVACHSDGMYVLAPVTTSLKKATTICRNNMVALADEMGISNYNDDDEDFYFGEGVCSFTETNGEFHYYKAVEVPSSATKKDFFVLKHSFEQEPIFVGCSKDIDKAKAMLVKDMSQFTMETMHIDINTGQGYDEDWELGLDGLCGWAGHLDDCYNWAIFREGWL